MDYDDPLLAEIYDHRTGSSMNESSRNDQAISVEQEVFEPTFTGSEYEHEWIMDSLAGFWQDGLITDVLYCVKGGKEATVYCCRAHPSMGVELMAAKVYRPRKFRALRNDAVYREGRAVLDVSGKALRDQRSHRALANRTRRGKALQAASWLRHEYDTLGLLHRAGADVVEPYAAAGNAILMEYVGDAGYGAPTLHEVSLGPAEAQMIFDRLIENVETMLACDRIHADLSAYNILYWDGVFRIIDLPQAIDPSTNPNAFAMLSRDVTRLCQYFTKQGVQSNPLAIVDSLWTRYLRHQL